MAVYYVRASGGSDGNDGLSFANGWATIQYGLSTITVGSTLLICADGVHTPASTLTFNNTASTITNPFIIKGASALGVDDGTMATISGSTLPAGNDLLDFSVSEFYVLKNIRATASKRHGVNVGSVFQGTLELVNCRIDNSVEVGINILSAYTTKSVKIISCEIDNNGTSGVYNQGNSDRSFTALINCSVHNNTSHGVRVHSTNTSSLVIGNRIYRNTGSGIYIGGSSTGYTIMNNIFFANNSRGLELSNATIGGFDIFNNIFRSNGSYGVYIPSFNVGQIFLFDYNCSHNNTSGHINVNGGVLPGSSNVLSDPLFTNETIGSEDFSLQTGSPCLNVGYGYNGV